MSQKFGTVANFESPKQILDAANAVKGKGYTHYECYTPFPVHGLHVACGHKPTHLPWIVLACGSFGFLLGVWLQWWTIEVDYPMIVGGKPYFDLALSVPICFELTVLFSAFGAVFGMLGLNKLPQWYHPLFKHEMFRHVTDDRFFIAIEATDPQYDASQVKSLLASLGGQDIEEVES